MSIDLEIVVHEQGYGPIKAKFAVGDRIDRVGSIVIHDYLGEDYEARAICGQEDYDDLIDNHEVFKDIIEPHKKFIADNEGAVAVIIRNDDDHVDDEDQNYVYFTIKYDCVLFNIRQKIADNDFYTNTKHLSCFVELSRKDLFEFTIIKEALS
jgi:hypothetical protein